MNSSVTVSSAEPRDPASLAAADALAADPFYQAISEPFAADPVRRRTVLADYFTCSIAEGARDGRVVHSPAPADGVAVWLLPQAATAEARATALKHAALQEILGPEGFATYRGIVRFMSDQSAGIVADDAWYLSILAVAPASQGQGLGRQLLAPTLAAADGAGVPCYLETFTPRTLAFYERLGFMTHRVIAEPTTRSDYAIMIRDARRS